MSKFPEDMLLKDLEFMTPKTLAKRKLNKGAKDFREMLRKLGFELEGEEGRVSNWNEMKVQTWHVNDLIKNMDNPWKRLTLWWSLKMSDEIEVKYVRPDMWGSASLTIHRYDNRVWFDKGEYD